ncbi:BREX-2 system adenine-specific DNA-methyltransferase PglX [Micromonospora zhanjiangensis]
MIPLKALQAQVTALTDDLREVVPHDSELLADLEKEYGQAKEARRTAAAFETWLEDILDQAAVAWVLGCVFVRFIEDNELLRPEPGESRPTLWLGGPDPAAPVGRAVENRQHYLIANPRHNDRHWLRQAFDYLRGLRATGKIFDGHNPVWRFPISGAAAERLSDFFRRGPGLVSLRKEDLDTRFLGDLYQDLSTHAKKTYALLQTPDFVEEFILDRTFEPAVREFGLPETKVIDPTCGSGHFLLGAFHRLVRKWREREPETDVRVLVERALGQVTGVDINPFAVAIARFRLLVAAMTFCGFRALERTPAWTVRVAAGDSLLRWGRGVADQGDLIATIEGKPAFTYLSEDADLLGDYLTEGQYTVVVGNPPYITVSDPARNQLYRSIYSSICHRQFQLTVPFAKRFFDLARRSDEHGEGAGRVGQITGNAFMKREFGKRLIEDYFAHKVELTEVIDTSGAYIPGHGTPTLILVGRANSRRRSSTVRTVLGVRGEPGQPEDPAMGLVWTAIVQQIDTPGSESGWVSVEDKPRAQLAAYPWSLAGGGAQAVMARIERKTRLAQAVEVIGRTTVLGEDDAWILPDAATARRLKEAGRVEVFVTGEHVRDYLIKDPLLVRSPYKDARHEALVGGDDPILQHLWPVRTSLGARRIFGRSMKQSGRHWYEHLENYKDRLKNPLSISFVFVATHNHFALDRGGKVFNRHAPVIKLSEGATEDDHLCLLGILSSSAACFWLKQVSHNKGSQGVNEGFKCFKSFRCRKRIRWGWRGCSTRWRSGSRA